MEQLYIKYQEAKTEWSAAHKANQEGWNGLKSLKGSEYKTAKASHELIRKRERLALNRRNKFFGKWK